MSDDLITSLRALAAARHDDLSVAVDAVIEIERLRAENDRLREVLRDIARTDYTDDPFCELTPEGLVRWRARHER